MLLLRAYPDRSLLATLGRADADTRGEAGVVMNKKKPPRPDVDSQKGRRAAHSTVSQRFAVVLRETIGQRRISGCGRRRYSYAGDLSAMLASGIETRNSPLFRALFHYKMSLVRLPCRARAAVGAGCETFGSRARTRFALRRSCTSSVLSRVLAPAVPFCGH